MIYIEFLAAGDCGKLSAYYQYCNIVAKFKSQHYID